MILKKNFLLLTLFLIITIQTLIYTNNNQKTSFRFFKWTAQEVSIGKLISISYFSGLFISTILTNTINSFKRNTVENYEDNYETLNNEDNYETLNNEKESKTNIEMPPQRDIRDTQPTISVNYRVVKNSEENNLKNDQYYSNSPDKKDDWDNDANDW